MTVRQFHCQDDSDIGGKKTKIQRQESCVSENNSGLSVME